MRGYVRVRHCVCASAGTAITGKTGTEMAPVLTIAYPIETPAAYHPATPSSPSICQCDPRRCSRADPDGRPATPGVPISTSAQRHRHAQNMVNQRRSAMEKLDLHTFPANGGSAHVYFHLRAAQCAPRAPRPSVDNMPDNAPGQADRVTPAAPCALSRGISPHPIHLTH